MTRFRTTVPSRRLPGGAEGDGGQARGAAKAPWACLDHFPEHREESVAIIFKRLHNEDPAVRCAAVWAIRNGLVLKPDLKQVIPALIVALKDNRCPHGDKKSSVGATAAFALSWRTRPDPRVAVPALQEALLKGGEPLRCRAGPGRISPAWRNMTRRPRRCGSGRRRRCELRHDESSEVRKAAAGTLGMLGKRAEGAVPELIKVVEAKRRPSFESRPLNP